MEIPATYCESTLKGAVKISAPAKIGSTVICNKVASVTLVSDGSRFAAGRDSATGSWEIASSPHPFDRAWGTAVPRPIRAIYASYERCRRNWYRRI